jgi:magnesium transporter
MRAQHVSARGFAERHPEDAARLIELQPAAESAAFLEELPAAAAAGVVQRMSPTAGADCLASMSPEPAAAIVESLPAAIGVALLRRTAPARRDAMLSHLSEEATDRFGRLLSFPEGSVGSVTDPGVLALPQDVSVGEALRQLRRHHGTAHHHVYVIDRALRLVGVIHLRDLVGGRSKDVLSTVMQPVRAHLAGASRITGAAAHPAWRDVDTLPVTDESGVLLGMVRARHLQRLASTAAPGDITDTLLSLGELYWIGLSAFLPGVASDAEVFESPIAASQGSRRDA